MPEYNKLVRDRIPEIVEAAGKRCEVRVLGEAEYVQRLEEKLGEELTEYRESGEIAELADLVEVVQALVRAKGVGLEEFEGIRRAKARERGGFGERLFLVRVSE